jgi:hypothetical protein
MIKPRSGSDTVAVEPSLSSRIHRRRGVVAVMWIHRGVASLSCGSTVAASDHGVAVTIHAPSCRCRHMPCSSRRGRSVRDAGQARRKIEPKTMPAHGAAYAAIAVSAPVDQWEGDEALVPAVELPTLKDSSYHAIIWAVFIGRTACIGYVTLVLKKI